MNLYSRQASKKIDELAIKFFNFSETFLIKKAGLECLKLVNQKFSDCKKIIVFCGIGNNGADGLMFAQYAYLSGFEVEVIGFFQPKTQNLTPHYQQIIAELEGLNLKIVHFKALKQNKTKEKLVAKLNQADLIVDAIFGIGLNRATTEDFKQAIELINLSKTKVLAIDIPSGLNANTGGLLNQVVHANATLTFITHKFGLYSAEGTDVSGQVFFNDLGIKVSNLINHLNANHKISQTDLKIIQPICKVPKFKKVKQFIAKRKNNSHKNHYGASLLIGGNHHMAGAIELASFASFKVGAGLSYVLTRKKNAQILPLIHPEIMAYQKKDLSQLLNKKNLTSIAIGPGLGNDFWAKSLFQSFLDYQKKLTTPIASVIDADGLNLLSDMKNGGGGLFRNTILTPHPKEAARLLQKSVNEIQNDRISAIKQLHQKYQATIVLKGKGSLVYDGTTLYLCRYGNSGMACGGMGDVLTGVITGLLAQKLPLINAALLGTIAHSYFADKCAKKVGKLGLSPSELINNFCL